VKAPTDLPGKSILPILEQVKPAGWDEVYGSHQFHEITMYYPMRSIRTREYQYIVNYAHQLEFPHAVDLWESDTWQGVLKRRDMSIGERPIETFLHRPKEELYDLTTDPHELKNVAEDPSKMKILNELRTRLYEWQKRTSDPWLIKGKHE
jgi:N-sulfoglucosamine sulfohydrolase